MIRLPDFFDNQKVDSGMEAMQDFFISWTIRCASEDSNEADSAVQAIAKHILQTMIFGNNCELPEKPFNGEIVGYRLISKYNPNEKRILDVQVTRQENYIDLVAKITLEENGIISKYLLNIENKYYHNITIDQLERGLNYVNKNYQSEYQIINILIVPDHNKINPNVIQQCNKIGYKIIAKPQLQNILDSQYPDRTGNYLFDEFWYEF